MSFRRAKKSAPVFRRSALFLPADLAVPCPRRLGAVVLLMRPFGLVPSIVIAELAIVDVESWGAYALPRRSEPAAPLLAPVIRRAGPRWSLGGQGFRFHLRAGSLVRQIRAARHVHQCHA